jgi:hypothetical protein
MGLEDKVQYTDEVRGWLKEVEDAAKREKDFKKDAKRTVELYEAKKRQQHQFNILYSNTETLLPALYNNTPRPVVDRRFKDADPLGKAAANVTKRMLEFLLDPNEQDYSNFDELLQTATLEALLPGRGVTRFKYEVEFEDMPAMPAADGQPPMPEAELQQRIKYETVCGQEVPWDNIYFGYARKWKDVPWLAFEHFPDRGELIKLFGEEIGAAVKLTVAPGQEGIDKKGGNDWVSKTDNVNNDPIFARVLEIWDKATKKVIFVSEGFGSPLKAPVEDPFGLSGFYPMPRPLGFMVKVSDMVPIPLYIMYEEQAKELNLITTRINRLSAALKVRGMYDSTIEGIDNLLQKGDNALIPAENIAAMLEGQSLEKAIWFFPIDKLITVLQQLYQQREQIKTTIYEITGISDILRGTSEASETATAQNIKNQWGTLRLKRMQKEVQRYARDCLRIMAEIGVNKLQTTTIAAMTGLDYPTAQKKQQAQQFAQQMQQLSQQTGQPLPPEKVEQHQELMAKPTWEDIMGVLKDDLQRTYKIDIETNSTVDVEATEDKSQVTEFLNAMAQYLNGVTPLMQEGLLDFNVVKGILAAIVRRFRFGVDIEDQINEMKPPEPKQDPKAAQLAAQQQADQATAQLDMQVKQKDVEGKMALMDKKMQIEEQKLLIEQEKLQIEHEKLQMERQQMQHTAALNAQAHEQKMSQMAMAAATAKAKPAQGE